MSRLRFRSLKLYRFYFVLTLLLMQACVVSERQELSDSEGLVSENFFQQIRPHKTEVSWVVDNLGEPYSLTELKSDAEVYTYHFQRSRVRSANAFLILRYGSREQHSDYYHMVVCDGLVRKAWWDKLEQVQERKALRKSRCIETVSLNNNIQVEKPALQNEPASSSAMQHKESASDDRMLNPVTTEDIEPL